MIDAHERDRAPGEVLGSRRHDGRRPGRHGAEQEAGQLPVQRQQQPDALRAGVAVDQQVRGLADPVLDRGARQLDARRPVVQGQER
jgi:hypothetical protein